MTHARRKEAIRSMMRDFLDHNRIDPSDSKTVLENLPQLWLHLQVAGLLLPQWTYDDFFEVAHYCAMKAELSSIYKGFGFKL